MHSGDFQGRARVTRMLAGVLLLAFSSTLSFAADAPVIVSIPYPLEVRSEQGSFAINAAQLSLTARKGTDLFADASGASKADNAPRLVFVPEGDFIFSAKLTGALSGAYDGGGLIVYAGPDDWGKLLFERFKSGKLGVASTVSDGRGDDAYHSTYESSSVFLKIARKGALYVFYTSENGADWNYTRSFTLNGTAVRVGFVSQSPFSESVTVDFSNITFRPSAFKDFWQGE